MAACKYASAYSGTKLTSVTVSMTRAREDEPFDVRTNAAVVSKHEMRSRSRWRPGLHDALISNFRSSLAKCK